MIKMSEDKADIVEGSGTEPVAAYESRYFVAVNEQLYIDAMLIAFTQSDADSYATQGLAELSQAEFESVGPDCQLIRGRVVKGPPLVPVLSEEASRAILSARIRDASEKIQMLTDAAELDMAQEGDSERLTAWKKYRVSLSQSDISAPLSDWPVSPD